MKRYKAIAAYYDPEYEHLPMLREDVPYFLRHLPKQRRSVLDLATGTARAGIPIAQSGHRVVGVDYAADMLAIARRKRDASGLADRQLSLIHRDISKLALTEKFDYVAIFFNTFLNFVTLADQDRLLQVVRKHLKPNGKFFLDILQPNLDLLARDVSRGLDPISFHVAEFDRTVHRVTDVKRDATQQTQTITFRYNWFDAHGLRHDERVDCTLTFFFPRELQLLLERNGLKIVKQVGDYSDRPLEPYSPRMITWCKRA